MQPESACSSGKISMRPPALTPSLSTRDEVDPLLTPITLDPAHPFPRVINKALCLALLLKRKRRGAGAQNSLLGVVTVPRALPRLISGPLDRRDP